MLLTMGCTWALVNKVLTHNSRKLWAAREPCWLHRKASPWANGINISPSSKLLKNEPVPWICQPRAHGLKSRKEEKGGTSSKTELGRQPMDQSNLWIQCNPPVKIQMASFRDIGKNAQIHMESQQTPVAKAILNKSKAEGITLHDFNVTKLWLPKQYGFDIKIDT